MSVITMDQIAVMSVQYVHYTFDYYLESMQKCNVKNIDIWGGSPHYCRLDYNSSVAASRKLHEMRDKAESMGMKVIIYNPELLGYPYSLSSPEQAIRDRTIDYYKWGIEDALELGTNQVFINTGCGPLNLPREESWQRTVESMCKICEIAEDHGVVMVLEQLQPYESNLLVNLPQLKDMMDKVNSPALAACVDLVAMAVAGESLEDYYQELGPENIALIHYADGDPSGHYILGDGNLPLKDYIKTLEKYDYDGIVDLEINDSIYWDDPHTSSKRSVDYLREFLPEH